MKLRYFVLLLVLTSTLLTGCVPSISPNAYNVQNAQTVNKAVPGVVVGSRYVNVAQNTGTGTLAGGIAGAALGSDIGGGARANIVGGVAGALAGGLLGNVIESRVSGQQGIEYIVRTQKGGLLSVVQGPPLIPTGTHVLVIGGAQARIIVDPQYQR